MEYGTQRKQILSEMCRIVEEPFLVIELTHLDFPDSRHHVSFKPGVFDKLFFNRLIDSVDFPTSERITDIACGLVIDYCDRYARYHQEETRTYSVRGHL